MFLVFLSLLYVFLSFFYFFSVDHQLHLSPIYFSHLIVNTIVNKKIHKIEITYLNASIASPSLRITTRIAFATADSIEHLAQLVLKSKILYFCVQDFVGVIR